MLKRMTKRLFGLKETAADQPIIIDGKIIQTHKRINVDTFKHINIQTRENEQLEDIAAQTSGPCPVEPEAGEQDETLPDRPDTPCLPCNSVPEQYYIFLGSAGRAARTIQEYGWELNWWQRQSSPLAALSLRDIEGIINRMHPATARRKIAALRSYAKWRLREGDDGLFITLSQVEIPRLPNRVPGDRGGDVFRELSCRARTLTGQGDRRGIWLGLMLCCGLRISEIRTAEAAPGGAVKVVGKGNRERLVPAPEWLRHALCDNRNKKNNTRWRKGRKLIWQEMKNMGINKPHSLRHTYASELVRQGLELEQVKKLLGHAKLDTTLIYARIKLPENLTERLGIE